jgi:hypothetical protein
MRLRAEIHLVRQEAAMTHTRRLLVLGILTAALFLAAPKAHAVSIFEFTSDHCSGGCGTPPFGTVTLVQNGSTVDVTVDLSAGNQFVKTGSADFMAFKFNATGVLLGDIAVEQTVMGQTLAPATGAFNGDGTGQFSFGIECSTCDGGASDAFDDNIVFHVANATIADLTAPNNLGNIFVADILSGETGNTGPVDVTGGSNGGVPEPGTLVLLASGGLAGLLIRRLGARGRS